MDAEQKGLENGSKVAVVGGGIAGAAMAAALMFTARARGRQLEVRVYGGGREQSSHRPPAVLSPECRSRLAALGVRIPPQWQGVELTGVEVISGRNRALLRAPSGGLWVVDGWPDGEGGTSQVAKALAHVASLHGAKFVGRTVERVEVAGRRPRDPAPQDGAGSLVLWAHGASQRAHSAVLASGVGAPVADHFFEGFCGPPTLPAAQARLRYGSLFQSPWLVAKLWLAPLPGVDGLYLIPCRGSIYALAWGPGAQPADLCQALMMASRDGHLQEGFEISHLSAARVPAGCGTRLCAPGQLAVGPAAVGHPLQLTVSETLASCSRAAIALVDGAADRRVLHRRYVRDGIFDLREDAQAVMRGLRWLHRAGEEAAPALARAQAHTAAGPAWGKGVLGLAAPVPQAVLSSARRAAFVAALRGMWRTAISPVPPALPRVEQELYYVVDDDAAMRETVTDLLESRGAEVVSFGDELALFCAVARRRPAAILLDVVLSWVDGLRLCEELKRHPLTRDVRVIMMSGLDRPWVRERALLAGAESFVPKPMAPERLLRALDPGTRHQPAWSPGLYPRTLVESDQTAS